MKWFNRGNMQYVSFPIVCKAGESRNMLQPDRVFRPTLIRVAVDAPGLVIIERLIFGNVDQLLGPVDAWNWSLKLAQSMRDDFMREHGLIGKKSEEIDAYLDANELSIPDPGRMMLPTVRPQETITIVGKFDVDTHVAFVGIANR